MSLIPSISSWVIISVSVFLCTATNAGRVDIDVTNFVEFGSVITLNCSTSDCQEPCHWNWYKDGSTLTPSSKRTIVSYKRGSKYHSDVRITDASMADAGTYVCRFGDFIDQPSGVSSDRVYVLEARYPNIKRGDNTPPGFWAAGVNSACTGNKSYEILTILMLTFFTMLTTSFITSLDKS